MWTSKIVENIRLNFLKLLENHIDKRIFNNIYINLNKLNFYTKNENILM